MTFRIGARSIGKEFPCFIIAEAGVNHNGNIGLAKELIIKAKEAGADCIKFQTFKADMLASVGAPKANYQLKTTDPYESQIDMLRKLELPYEAYPELLELCKKIDINFMSTPYNEEDVIFLEKLGVNAYKLASMSIVEPSFLRFVANKRKPLIMSTGMATLKEVMEGVSAVLSTGNEHVMILQCTTNYPTELDDVNLNAMITMKNATNLLVGFSDHTQSNIACIAAVAMGASVIEKHFTLDKALPGPDHSSSYTPDEFSLLVKEIRDSERVLGVSTKSPTLTEQKNIEGMRRSVAARVDIPAGAKINKDMLTLMRPGTYILAKDMENIIGRTVNKSLKSGAFILATDLN